ncbi:hypothetical protein K503DRAFT_868131 [Rhizopogon vinicolor AM-OR11-026]|uniref:Uncharacterized protein n=1 Tax=Rhizopogon vinicolor AM-OR11-026 TaxID=1314800 RepID=A0A1B7MSU5_9AGAM|nr:hypothetical protein K503DRAFT_868131 [Rhizopogon vinicolor AM-OR11-026]
MDAASARPHDVTSRSSALIITINSKHMVHRFDEQVPESRREGLEYTGGHGERRSERHENREERRHERHEEHQRPHHHDQDQPHYAPPPGGPPGGYNRADFVSDDGFQRMMQSGEFEKPRMGGHIGPEDFGEWDQSRPPPNSGYQPSYQQQSSQGYQQFSEPPPPPIPHEQRPSGYGHESGAYAQPPHNSYSAPEAFQPHHGSSAYAPPSGAPGAYASHAPAGGFAPPPGPPPQTRPSYGYDASQTQGNSGRGAASDYYNGSSPGQQAHSYSHIPDIAATHSDSPNPALYQQYHEAAQGLHENYQAQPPHPSGEFDEEKYNSHFAAHAQAYGSDSDNRPMANDDIGAAAAVEALKITAANNQQPNARPQQGGRPQGGFMNTTDTSQDRPSGAQQGGRPSGGMPHGRPQSAEESESGSEDEGDAKPQAPKGPQDKIIALAMAQAGKLFDKKGGGDNQGKSQAMQTAAATAMRMMTEYKSTGKVNMQAGETQKLMGLAMSLF